MDLYSLIQIKFPDINWLSNECKIGIENEKQYIAHWGRAEPQPSEQDLLDWAQEQEVITAYTKQRNSDLNAPILKQLDELDNKSIRALRSNDTVRLQELEAQAVALRAQLLK